MKRIASGLAFAAALAAIAGAAPAAADEPGMSPSATVGDGAEGAGAVFDDLAGFGYDLGWFRPDHDGRYPYRRQ